MSQFRTGFLALLSVPLLASCEHPETLAGYGGPRPTMTLPFESGEYWLVTQGYETGSHIDYGFPYGHDQYAIDFSQNGCDPYGKPITPILEGTIMRLEYADTDSDAGYGNSVLVQHEDGYVSRYGHMTGHNTQVGDSVDTNDVIGWVGNTGYVLGASCSDHPGTHLHLALYQDGEAVMPLPLSSTLMAVGCWYNREGKESCNGDPGPYDPIGGSSGSSSGSDYDDEEAIEDDGDGLNVGYLDISPEQGTADHTEYIWVATVVSDDKPSATLYITNPNDGVTYDFGMSTDSERSPWVFTTQKTLNDPSTYTYWVEAEVDGRSDSSSSQRVSVNDDRWEDIDFVTTAHNPSHGEANETEFEWEAWVESEDRPNIELKIVNPNDATLYSFPMDPDDAGGDLWIAYYEKTLNSENTVYPYWFEIESNGSRQNSDVDSVETE